MRNSLGVFYRSCHLCKKGVTSSFFPASENIKGFCFSFLSLSIFLFLERGKTLVQRKPTMYPAWKACFDAHIYEGRVLEVLLMKTAEEPLAEVTVGVSVLAERCKKANGRAEFWVGHHRLSSVPAEQYLSLSVCVTLCLCVQVDLHPSGKVMMAVQYFLEGGDTGKRNKIILYFLLFFTLS